MKKQDGLTVREEKLMNFLWEEGEPLTAGEMAERLKAEGWSTVTLLKTVQSLTDEGCLAVAGLEKNKKSYARKLVPAFTKEEYYANVMMKHGIDSRSIADITAAFLGVADKSSKEKVLICTFSSPSNCCLLPLHHHPHLLTVGTACDKKSPFSAYSHRH